MRRSTDSLNLTVGPLHYRLVAHDDWGQGALARLRQNVECVPFSGGPDRAIHLLEYILDREDIQGLRSHRLPERLAAAIGARLPKTRWGLTTDTTGCATWCRPGTTTTVWTHSTQFAEQPARFELPWQPVLTDIVARGGGLLHGGLAVLEGRGYIFTAPPGGGKTTALSRTPPPWKALADDAILIWPTRNGRFTASPLPTWSVLLQRSEAPPGVEQWGIATCVDVAGILLLRKAEQNQLFRVQPIEAAQAIYRALSEHPRVLTSRDPLRKNLFRTSCSLARTIPAWELELTRRADFWSMLNDAFGAD
jgi:hypothetical protein